MKIYWGNFILAGLSGGLAGYFSGVSGVIGVSVIGFVVGLIFPEWFIRD